MADRYVWSGATGAANGTSWANAFTTIAQADAVDTAGDFIYVADDHFENHTANVTWNWAASGLQSTASTTLLCVNRGTGDLSEGATIQTTGGFFINPHGQGVSSFQRGLKFVSGIGSTGGPTAARAISIGQAGQGRVITFRKCTFDVQATVAQSVGWMGTLPAFLDECWFNALHSGSSMQVPALFRWTGGGIVAGSATTTLCALVTYGGGVNATLSGLDLSGAASNLNLFSANVGVKAVVRDCRLPNGWTGGLVALGWGPTISRSRISMYNCDNADTNYRLWIETPEGSIKSETSTLRTGGATDGTTPISWRIDTRLNASEFVSPLETDPIAVWSEDVGTPKTLTIEIAQEGGALLSDSEAWLEVTYPGEATNPIAYTINDKRATILTAPATHATSTADWTGLTSPTKQKLQVTFTPQRKGPLTAVVYFSKPLTTVFVCPKPDLT